MTLLIPRPRIRAFLIAAPLTAVTALAAPVNATSAAGPAAGPVAAAFTVQDGVSLSGYDLATDSAGTSYLGWISSTTSSDRTVHLCVLPPGARACAGGVLSTDSLGSSSAEGLQVVAPAAGHATLVWMHDTVQSINSSMGARIATAAYAGGHLAAAVDHGNAPSFGSLLTVTPGPDGQLWPVTQSGGPSPKIQVRDGLSGAQTQLTAPWGVGGAWLAFAGSMPVLAVDRYGAISEPVNYTVRSGQSWSAFHSVPRTWNVGNAVGMVGTSHGIRLVASESNPGYRPVVSRFSGTSFGIPTLTGDTNPCTPNSHDLVTDESGRVADVTNECSHIAVTNMPDTTHAAVFRFAVGTVAGGPPQITTAPSGRGWVAYGVESTVADRLLVRPVLLTDRTQVVRKSGVWGRARLTGPATCLPPVTAPAALLVHHAHHWKVRSRRLMLGTSRVTGSQVNGSALRPGTSYSLRSTVRLVRTAHHHKHRKTVHLALSFRTCPTP